MTRDSTDSAGPAFATFWSFPNFPPGVCQQVTLSTNYRSHPDIIAFYNEWMQQINWQRDGKAFRYDKQIVPRQDTFPNVPSVLKLSHQGTAEEYYEEVYQFIIHLSRGRHTY